MPFENRAQGANRTPDTTPPAEAPFAQLERSLIHEYLRMYGHDHDSLAALSERERDALLKDASLYASGKLSEVETRSHFVDKLHDAIGDVPKAGKA